MNVRLNESGDAEGLGVKGGRGAGRGEERRLSWWFSMSLSAWTWTSRAFLMSETVRLVCFRLPLRPCGLTLSVWDAMGDGDRDADRMNEEDDARGSSSSSTMI